MTKPKTANTIKTSNIFLDTEVLVEANFNYNSPRLVSLADLASGGRIRVFLTDLTVREIRSNIKEAVERAVTARPQAILRNSSLPQVKALFNALDAAEVKKDLFVQLDDFINKAGITILPVKNESVGPVLDNYFNRLPPFGPGKNKAEFPDAFALETLKEWCHAEQCDMAVVTRDEGVKAACLQNGPLYYFEDLPKYLDAVASDDKILSAFIRKMVQGYQDEIFDMAKDAFPTLGFYLNDQEGDVNGAELTDIEYDGKVEIISLAADNAIIEIPATLTFDADISYADPATGFWDKEDKVLLFQETVEAAVTREAHRSVALEITFKALDPNILPGPPSLVREITRTSRWNQTGCAKDEPYKWRRREHVKRIMRRAQLIPPCACAMDLSNRDWKSGPPAPK